MRGNVGGLSPAAQKLVELTKDASGGYGEDLSGLDVSKVLQDHPDLMSGLNEYLTWRDNENRDIGETKQATPTGHEMSRLLISISKKNKRKKGK
jgi:hypothetical protein